MGKMAQISPDFKNSNSQSLMRTSKEVAKNIKGFCFFFFFLAYLDNEYVTKFG